MKRKANKLKIRIKRLLIIKIADLRKQLKLYENKIIENVKKEQQYIDKITLLENEIRELNLKVKELEK